MDDSEETAFDLPLVTHEPLHPPSIQGGHEGSSASGLPMVEIALISHTGFEVSTMPDRVEEIIFVVTEEPEGGFSARALGESIVTQAEDMEALKAAVRDAVICHFDEGLAPRLIRLHLVKDFLVAV
ncbi:MAG: hypothetical protein P4L11_06995 [Geothrix sp.]|nr:hypothetical protein [Geothrix sp.]